MCTYMHTYIHTYIQAYKKPWGIKSLKAAGLSCLQ